MRSRKIHITVCLLWISIAALGQTQTWIVDNNISRPAGSHIIGDLPAAITAASAGDTLYVKASPLNYNNATIDKPLTIIGEGFRGKAATVDQLNITMDASNSRVYGMKITDVLAFNGAGTANELTDVRIAYNFIEEVIWNSGSGTDTVRNLTITSNIIGSGQTSSGVEALFLNNRTAGSLTIDNNVFYGTTSSTVGASIRAEGAYIYGNVFVGTGTQVAFDYLLNSSVINNIFYGRSAEALNGTSAGNYFYNNISFSTSDDDMVNVLGVIGTDGGLNQVIDPEFTSLSLATTWNFDQDSIAYGMDSPAGNNSIGPTEGGFTESGAWLPTIRSISGQTMVPEGSGLFLDVVAFIDDGFHDVPALTNFEYFLDGTDLGFGSNLISITTGEIEVYNDQVYFETNLFSPGNYTLYVRVADENRWGHYTAYPLTIVDNSLQGYDINGLEYYFDNDPGVGLGVPIAASRASSVDLLETLSSDTLSQGFHNLFVRSVDQHGRWGLPQSNLLYVDNSLPGGVTMVQNIEYFFDDDPGFGLADPLTISSPANEIEIVSSIPTSGESLGFHNLFIRAQDDGGIWSLNISRLVYVDQSGATDVSNIAAAEYFFDSDPGFGLGIPLSVPTPGDTLEIVDMIATDTVSLGFHKLFIRVQDDGGTWSLPINHLVFVDESGANDVLNITSFEYYFDVDPGHVLATAITVDPAANMVDQVINLSSDTLSAGFHNLFIRAQIEGGKWGLPISRLVYVDLSSGVATPVESAEYFFDSDPGYGLANPIDLTDGATINEAITLISDTLSLGFHNMFIRVRDTGGRWGQADKRLVFVDHSNAGVATPVAQVEYYFDHDPGYGLANTIDVTDAGTVEEILNVISDTLSIGFHQFHIRAQDAGGRWGLPISRLVYVDAAGNIISDIEEIEYFFDVDPGYGLGQSIPINPPNANAMRSVILGASELPAGNHTIGFRARNSSDIWGITEHVEFISFPPSRELDSVSLIAFYNATDGANWNQGNNWITGSLDTWYGVTLRNNRVDSVKLQGNNIEGVIPRPLGFLDQMTYLSLAENLLRDTIPESMADLNSLITLHLHDNQFNEIPNLSSISALESISLDSNFFDFGDLEPLAGVTNLTYSNQEVFDDFSVDSVAVLGRALTIDKLIEGVNNNYQWYQDEQPIEFGDLEDYQILALTSEDTGTYILRVTNTIVPGLTLETSPFRISISDFSEDSLALVSLYNALNGVEWTASGNWLSAPLSNWEGVSLTNQRVTGLNLTNKNLSGQVPEDFSYADSLIVLNLSQNKIAYTIPQSMDQLKQLSTLNLSSNQITSIPNLKVLTGLTSFDVSQNRLQFGDLENNIGIDGFAYANQDSVGIYQDTVVDINTSLLISKMVSGVNNQYQWHLDGSPITGANGSEINVQNIVFANEGEYVLKVTNPNVPGLTLSTRGFKLLVSSLRRDSLALMQLYNRTGGANWNPPVNWTSASLADNEWDGVEVSSSRVTEIDLSGRNLRDTVPARIRDITGLEVLDLANNHIAAIPNLSGMQRINTLNLDTNRLVFKYLIPNRGITGISYANQRRFGQPVSDTLEAGERIALEGYENIDFGSGSVFQWNFGPLKPGQPFNDEVSPIDGAKSQLYTIEEVNINSQGTYRLTVVHPLIPGLVLNSRNQNIMAKTDFFGGVFLNSTPVTDAEVIVWRKTPSGPFVKEDSAFVDGSGEYRLEDVVLGTFIVLARPNREIAAYENSVQTYYVTSTTYSQADELLLDGPTPGINISLVDYTPEPVGTAIVRGTVESDFEDVVFVEGGTRIDGRRKVKKAACSMRRFKSTGRDLQEVEDEIAYYIETDDEGFFNFEGVDEGKYLLNIEFPGVPMDNTSEVVFEIGGNKENQIFEVNALIKETGIVVEQEEILFNWKPYLKDLVIYPNPTKGRMAVDYTVYRHLEDLKVILVDMEGKILIEQTTNHVKGRWTVGIDLTNFSQGVYHLIFSDEAGSFAQQVKLVRE